MIKCKVLLIGGSAGSLEVLLRVLPMLAIPSFAIVVIVHRKEANDSTLEELIGLKSAVPLCETEDKTMLKPGYLYLAPSGYHLLFEKNEMLSLDTSEKINHSRPSIDVSFESAADTFGNTTVGILLSGANSDGTQGLKAIKAAGGIIAIQDPNDAEIPFMPSFAQEKADLDYVLKVEEMAEFINRLNRNTI